MGDKTDDRPVQGPLNEFKAGNGPRMAEDRRGKKIEKAPEPCLEGLDKVTVDGIRQAIDCLYVDSNGELHLVTQGSLLGHPNGMTNDEKDMLLGKPDIRAIIIQLGCLGVPYEVLAEGLGISATEFSVRFSKVLKQSKHLANAKIAATCFEKAKEGDNASMFFWLKSQAGWRDSQRIEISTDGSFVSAPRQITREEWEKRKELEDKCIDITQKGEDDED